jgi:hypothetical protein
MVHSVSTVECSQLVPSTKTLKFVAIFDQQVQTRTTHLTTDYERLSAETVKLRRLVEIKSQMGGNSLLLALRSWRRPVSSSCASILD